jgi:DNA-binding NtrC family response regulator
MKDQRTTVRRPLAALLGARRRQLVVVSTPDDRARGRRVPLGTEPLEIGRGVEGPGAVADRALSRRHFRVFAEDDGTLHAEDLGGANGTFVDGARLRAPRALGGDEVIWAGDTLFVVETEPAEDGLAVAHDVDGRRATAFVGESLFADRIRRALETAATADGAVLLLGPSGAGKEVSAGLIHALSGRGGPFVAVNCAAIPSELAESELFGHEKGAFTGADHKKDGHFVAADGGTLFLDEVGELPPGLQSKLLRVLETGVVSPVGGKPVSVDVRVVAATNRDVHADDGAFRGDLLARLSDWVIRLPALRARRVDVLPLFRTFLARAMTTGAPPETTPLFDAALVAWDWPFNVREVDKLARRLARLARPGQPLDVRDLPPPMREALVSTEELVRETTGETPVADRSQAEATAPEDATISPSRPLVEIPPREELVDALRATGGNINKIAKDRGLHRMQIYRWMQKYDLDPDDYR